MWSLTHSAYRCKTVGISYIILTWLVVQGIYEADMRYHKCRSNGVLSYIDEKVIYLLKIGKFTDECNNHMLSVKK